MEKICFISFFIFSVFFSACSKTGGGEWNYHGLAMISYSFDDLPYPYYWLDKDDEINVNMIIRSDFSDDAFIVLYAVKEYRPYTRYYFLDTTTNEIEFSHYVSHPFIYEGFKDSMKIADFSIRSYFQYHNSLVDAKNGAYHGEPDDFPVYFKEISVRKGINREHFKIVFPRELISIPGKVHVGLGIGLYNDEMKKRFEIFPEVCELYDEDITYKNFYFEAFPDSSMTSLAFSSFTLLGRIYFFPEVSGKPFFIGRPGITLNEYGGAPEMRFDEYIYK